MRAGEGKREEEGERERDGSVSDEDQSKGCAAILAPGVYPRPSLVPSQHPCVKAPAPALLCCSLIVDCPNYYHGTH